MENYESKLLEIKSAKLTKPISRIHYRQLTSLTSIESSKEYGNEVKRLADLLPFKVNRWPSFGDYSDDWFKVEVNEFDNQLQYCERGSIDIRQNCSNQIDLFFYILDAVMPSFTSSAIELSNELDRIKDQRLLLWLSMSSKIYLMYQVNEYFGLKALIKNVTWMCQELVRMGVFKTTSEAFKSDKHILSGLSICGMPIEIAKELYNKLNYA